MLLKSNNKKMLFGLAIAISAIGISCKKYLEVEPVSYFNTGFVFDNPANTRSAVNAIYNSISGDNGYGLKLSLYFAYDDDIMMGQGGTPYPDNERRDVAHFNVTSSNIQLPGPYNGLYAGIERANLCIYYIPKADLFTNGTTAQKADYKRSLGEAYTLRALLYTELIRNWGDVTAQFEPSFLSTNLFLPKTDRDTIYNRLLDDLALAETLVPWRTEVTGGADERITQGAVRGLRARIALYRGGYSLRRNRQMERGSNYLYYYQIAKDECAAIMLRTADHKLNPSYQAVWKDNICQHKLEPNGEVIWEVAMTGGNSATDSRFGYYNGPRWGAIGNSALTVLPNYYYMFDSTDMRRDVMCAPYVVNTNFTYLAKNVAGIIDGKFRKEWQSGGVLTAGATSNYYGVNWPILRMSDVYLMFAEADNELSGGPTAAAKLAFETVRKRAFVAGDPLIGITPTTQSTFFDAIVKERALELGGEGIRKFDLIRWNMFASKIAQTKALLAVMAARSAAPWNTYPVTMYYNKVNTITNGFLWTTSLYKPTPTTAPPTTINASIAWLGSTITTTITPFYAVAFTAGKSELLPIPQQAIDANTPALTQDYGY
jgi:starch-binding outer membrane protein, SusD/RagB family